MKGVFLRVFERRGRGVCILACLSALALSAQTSPSGGGATPPTRPAFLPSSGVSQPGAVIAEQAALPGSGVSTISSTVQVTGDFAGSVPQPNVAEGAVTLSLADAVQRGIRANLAALTSDDAVRTAGANRQQELSGLLPNISANVSETVSQVNLAAYGFQFKTPPGFNFSIPSVVGPFSYFSATASLSQSVYDPVQRRNWHASKDTQRAAVLSARDARELIVLAVGGTYLQTLAAAANIVSQRAQVANAQAIYDQAVTRKAAGTNAKIDVMRSLVELQTQQQRLTSLVADFRKQKIILARITGIPLDRELILSEPLRFEPSPIPSTDTLLNRAYAQRWDLRASEAQVKAAEQILSAARAERWPSFSIDGDYGVLGSSAVSSHGVFAVTGSASIPIWQGGRTGADIQQAQATLDERRSELADARGRVEQDVRTALIELEAAEGQAKVAESNRSYANETLSEARDRFNAGVATTVEVVQAQEQVASAESDYVSSLFSFNLARLTLARATGQAEKELPHLLQGEQPSEGKQP